MLVVSTFLKPEHSPEFGQQALLMVFDTLVDKKSVVVGITVGAVEGNDIDKVRVSQVGQMVIERLGDHRSRNYPDGPVVIAGVAKVTGAKERVRNVLAQAPEHSAIILVCANDKVYDAAFPALCVDYSSANVNLQ